MKSYKTNKKIAAGLVILFVVGIAVLVYANKGPRLVTPAIASDSGQPPEGTVVQPSLSDEVVALRQRMDQMEKTIAAQAELIAQQKLVLDKLTENVPEIKVALTPPAPKTLVKSFVLDGVNVFQPKQLEPILKKYRNQELSLPDLEKVAEEISAFYRSKGYVNSVAYLPTQEIVDNTVEFRVVEGRVGEITIEKPKYSKESTIDKKFLVEEGEIMRSDKMAASLEQINRNPDLTMRAVLSPGKEPGTSDIALKVEKERAPYHFYVDFNNRGTNTTNERRWGLSFVNSNLMGWDDALSIRSLANPSTTDVFSFSGDYNLPITKYNTRLGVYALYAKADVGGQFAIISPQGRAQAFGAYISHPWFKKEFIDDQTNSKMTLASNLTAGIDSVNVLNKVLGEKTSHDKITALKAGINFDEKDDMGRSMMSAEIRSGIPDFMGSMSKHDVFASRAPSDAGSQFEKYLFAINRTTYLPARSLLVNNFRYQVTSKPLVTPEQMIIGGADSVRGFPENEYLADYGWIVNNEIRTPAFLIPSMIKLPFDKKGTRLIDALQFVFFLDAGQGRLKNARTGEIAKKQLVGSGFGLRFDLYEHLRARVDFGFPTGSQAPSDGAAFRVHYGLQYEW